MNSQKRSAKSTSVTQELNQVKALVYILEAVLVITKAKKGSVKGFALETKTKQTQSTKPINKVTVQREQATIPL